jgi:AcrR family transcriptional regulator
VSIPAVRHKDIAVTSHDPRDEEHALAQPTENRRATGTGDGTGTRTGDGTGTRTGDGTGTRTGNGTTGPDGQAVEATRRRLTPRQAGAIARLVEAAAEEARERGYEGTTVRGAAKRAQVAPATAYTYFASKDHLLAEVLWRRMSSLPEPDRGRAADPRRDVQAELRALSLFVSDDPRLAEACTTALLGSGPEVRDLRARFGGEVHRRLAGALGDAADPAVLRALDLAYSGAMLWAGMGHVPFEEVPAALADLAELLLGPVR